jgi:hypothetical protein
MLKLGRRPRCYGGIKPHLNKTFIDSNGHLTKLLFPASSYPKTQSLVLLQEPSYQSSFRSCLAFLNNLDSFLQRQLLMSCLAILNDVELIAS